LRVQPWQEYGRVSTRLGLKTKAADIDTIVRTIQLLILSRGKVAEAAKVRATLETLLR
jgi:hypothetical protein